MLALASNSKINLGGKGRKTFLTFKKHSIFVVCRPQLRIEALKKNQKVVYRQYQNSSLFYNLNTILYICDIGIVSDFVSVFYCGTNCIQNPSMDRSFYEKSESRLSSILKPAPYFAIWISSYTYNAGILSDILLGYFEDANCIKALSRDQGFKKYDSSLLTITNHDVTILMSDLHETNNFSIALLVSGIICGLYYKCSLGA
jgi:hypothetical protein